MNFFERQLHAVVALACVSLSSLFFIACSESSGSEGGEDGEKSLTLCSDTKPSKRFSGKGTASEPYLISDASDMLLFIEYASENETEGKHFSLKNDLYISPDFSWSAIGNSVHPFGGIFDGENHTISGSLNFARMQNVPYYDGAPMDSVDFYDYGHYFGLFGYCSNFEIRNLNVTADAKLMVKIDYNSPSNRLLYLSNLVAYGVYGIIENCNVVGDLSTTSVGCMISGTDDAFNMGQLCGYAGDIQIDNCSADGDLTCLNVLSAEMMVGGVCGNSSDSDMNNCEHSGNIQVSSANSNALRVGGVVGKITQYELQNILNISNCSNSGSLKSDMYVRGETAFCSLGGIVGYALSSFSIDNCINTAQIINNRSTFNGESQMLYCGVGGIVGECYGDKEYTFVANCTNKAQNIYSMPLYGEGSSFNCVGGIGGRIYDANCQNCTNEGVVRYTYGELVEPVHMGGIAGDFVADGNELHNCTNKGNVVGGNPESNFTGAIVGTYSDKSGLKEPCIYDCNVNSGFVSNANNEEKLAGFVFGSDPFGSYIKPCPAGE